VSIVSEMLTCPSICCTTFVRSLRRHERGARVPEIMNPDSRQPDTLQQPPEGPVGEVAHVHGRADGRSEYELEVLLQGADLQPFLVLRCFVGLRARTAAVVSLTLRVWPCLGAVSRRVRPLCEVAC
jgi:hypothetical protein